MISAGVARAWYRRSILAILRAIVAYNAAISVEHANTRSIRRARSMCAHPSPCNKRNGKNAYNAHPIGVH